MPIAVFVVRATVSDASKRQAFDAWYSREHLPDAVKSFGATKAWRYWSFSEPSLHQAMYQFPDKAALERAINSEDMKRLIADFNRDWPGDAHARDAGAGGGTWGVTVVVPAKAGTTIEGLASQI
jgi:hypothetical protein